MALRLAINNGEADCERRSSQRVTGSSGVANRGTSDLRGLGEAASRLPFQLIAACGSLRLLSFWGELYDHFDRYRRIAVLQTRRYPSLSSSHRDIVEGVLARKSNEAARLLQVHIEESASEITIMLGSKVRALATGVRRRGAKLPRPNRCRYSVTLASYRAPPSSRRRQLTKAQRAKESHR
jgi:DNA-binding GntR family transcriptional regulator